MLGKLLYQSRLKYTHLQTQVKASLGLGQYPSFIIIGAQKSGTTSLFRYLTTHPELSLPFIKEKHFFSNNYALGLPHYKASFPGGKKITGEATPYYLFDEQTPALVKQNLPDVKLIILLRDPVLRAFSHYLHNSIYPERESLSFKEAIAQEEERTKQSPIHLKNYSYRQRGVYLPQLLRWEALFPKEQILLLSSEYFFNETETAWKEVLSFLELSKSQLPNPAIYNKSAGDEVPDAETKEWLCRFFEPHNEALFKHLGKRFDWIS